MMQKADWWVGPDVTKKKKKKKKVKKKKKKKVKSTYRPYFFLAWNLKHNYFFLV